MHDDPLDHEHSSETERYGNEEDHPLAKLDTIRLTSVGIDVGTATSQVILSRLVLRRMGLGLSSRFIVTEREVLHLAPVSFTPYTANRERIDERALAAIVDEAYRNAGVGPEDVDTGAIILTGEAVRRENARAIAEVFAEQRGSFVCATAGHNFEAVLAAHGSGTVAASREAQSRLLNVDIGGGTTKLTIVDKGRVLATAAFHIGGRLVARDAAGALTVLEPGGDYLAKHAGFEWKLGEKVNDDSLDRLAADVAKTLVSVLTQAHLPEEQAHLFLTDQLPGAKQYDGVIFSGGVSE
ncbi:MAG: recombinase, partial [Dehalococcoidia bacterium]|nr:recombinase [Dehalococcoidia bacterium]